ncbi:MAG: type II secretion system minor pseudopilin GspK [Proteobacteria bacterium]|nr:type II secretion system minor pseudopilin GspK [Pseudomonadota bacterium]
MKRSRGVALIIALVVVALATVMATRIGAQSALDQRRAATLLAQEQAFQIALGAETWAIEVLRADYEHNNRQVTLDQSWATPLPPMPIDGGELTGQLEDLAGRFNLNNLVNADGTKNVFAFAWFQRLLTQLQLEPKWASLLLDWIDPDTIADGVDGAEDGVYTGLAPPYRPPNRPITSTSELLALPGFGLERYRLIAPYVAALPVATPLNVCTASGLLLDTLAPGMTAFGQDPKQLMTNRQKGCFPSLADVTAMLTPLLQPLPTDAALRLIGESSRYFRGQTIVSIGTTELTLYSLLERNPGGYSRVVLRTFGTE